MSNAETTGPTAARGEPATERPPALVKAPTDAHLAPALDQPFDEDGLFTLRSAVAAHAAELGADRSLPDTILVAHELSSNAVRHGGGSGRLRLWRVGDFLYCQVCDSGPGLADPERAGTVRPAPSVPGGRGLWIARHLADLQIVSGPDGTRITAAIRAT